MELRILGIVDPDSGEMKFEGNVGEGTWILTEKGMSVISEIKMNRGIRNIKIAEIAGLTNQALLSTYQ